MIFNKGRVGIRGHGASQKIGSHGVDCRSYTSGIAGISSHLTHNMRLTGSSICEFDIFTYKMNDDKAIQTHDHLLCIDIATLNAAQLPL